MENTDLDTLKISQNSKVNKKFDAGQNVLLSGLVVKINHVNKRQQRALIVTTKNVFNVSSPNSLLPNRIKRKIPLHQIIGVTTSRYGNEIVIHVDKEDDYRCISVNLKMKYIEVIILAIGKATYKPVNFYVYDDLVLGAYTTTIVDIGKRKRKTHKIHPIVVDEKYLQSNVLLKPESKIIFKGQSKENVDSFEEFDIIKVLGRGAFGKVMLCKHSQNGRYYAVKSMRKEDLIEKQSIERTKVERLLLEKVNHPFLVNIQFAFQTRQKIFLVMKFFRGGEMFSRIKKEKRFKEQRAKFYAAQVYLALEELHKLGYAYRDLKPENILFDMNGYIKVSDYGLAKELKEGEKTHSLTGTASYLSPEVILNEGHSFTVDWWALGVFIYEMIFGVPPFYCRYQSEMFQRIVNRELEFPKDTPISPQCRSLLVSLLNKYPHKRLGHKGSQQVKDHPWFKDYAWQDLMNLKIVPEFIPQPISDDDVSNFLDVFTSQKPIDTLINADNKILKKYDKQFQQFNYEGSNHNFDVSRNDSHFSEFSPEARDQKIQEIAEVINSPSFKKKLQS